MRITKRSNIAMRVLMFCGTHPDRLVTKSEIAETCKTSESHLAQVINRLAQLGFLHTQRGRAGGIALGRPADQIMIGDVFRQMEEYVPSTNCFADVDNTCPLVRGCRLRVAIADAAEAFFAHLDGMTLDAMICDNPALMEIFAPSGCSERGTARA